jgi:hypothetical protein
MNRRLLWRIGLFAVVVGFAALGFWLAPSQRAIPAVVEPTRRVSPPGGPESGRVLKQPAPAATASAEVAPLAAHTAARVEKIKRDYEEVRAKAATDYAAAGKDFPGGLNGFLRQLALLEREKRADLAAVLSPRELEDFELRETTAGQTVQRLLGDTVASDGQRRAVFRLQFEFEDRFALTFDLTPAALLERETARQQLNGQIRAILGDDLFAAWLRGEGADYAPMAALAERQGLPLAASLELWQTRAEYTRRRLELNAATGMSAAQKRAANAALVRQTELRLIGLLGAGSVQLERNSTFQWLPKP